VLAHDDGLLLARLVQVHGVEPHGVLGSELEDVAHLDHPLDLEGLAAPGTALAGQGHLEIGPVAAEVLARPHPDEMKAVAVGADHVWPALERLIGDHAYATLETHGTDGAHGDAETLAHLLRARRAGLGAERARELALVETVVAAYEGGNGRAPGHVRGAFGTAGGAGGELGRPLGDGPGPGGGAFGR